MSVLVTMRFDFPFDAVGVSLHKVFGMIKTTGWSGAAGGEMDKKSSDLRLPLFHGHLPGSRRAILAALGITRICPTVYPDSEGHRSSFQGEGAEGT